MGPDVLFIEQDYIYIGDNAAVIFSFLDVQLEFVESQACQSIGQYVFGNAKIDEGAQEHVSACAGFAVNVECAHEQIV